MKSFEQFVSESIIDFRQETLDPMVFAQGGSEKPVLNPAIKTQIMQGIVPFARIGNFHKVYIIGSILTHRWTPKSDIDVNVILDKDSSEEDQKIATQLCREMNGKPAVGTEHPINYYVTFLDTVAPENWANIYDPREDTWVKTTPDEKVDINKYMDDFSQKVAKLDVGIGNLRRNIIDYRKLRRFSPRQLKNGQTMCRARMRNITDMIAGMEDVHQQIRKLRMDAFARPMTPRELRRIRSKNALPENIIYKLMEYYWYWELVEDLKRALGENEKIESGDDVKKVEDAITKFNNKMKKD